jgi:hypothetical protein
MKTSSRESGQSSAFELYVIIARNSSEAVIRTAEHKTDTDLSLFVIASKNRSVRTSTSPLASVLSDLGMPSNVLL